MPRFTNLRVYEAARDVLRRVSVACSTMRSEGDLKSQLRRAAISIVSNISEGSERGSDPVFAQFLRTARGSCAEVHAQMLIAGDLDLLPAAQVTELTRRLESLGRMLTRFIDRLDAGP